MRLDMLAGLLSISLLQSFGQSGAVIPQGGSGHAPKASCVILKRMGPADQVTSHLYSFGIRGKQFQYIEGKLPEGFPFHGRLTDHDVRNLQGRGTEVIVLESHYTSDDLKQARDDCRGETGTTPNQAESKAAPLQATVPASPTAVEAKQDAPNVTSSSPAAAQIDISSTPSGADIEVDGRFVGSTPSSITLVPGDHQITVKKAGFTPWDRKLTVSAGRINISAELVAEAK